MALWLTALQVIPWKDVIEATPAVVQGARALWKRSQQSKDAPTPESMQPESDPLRAELARLQDEVQESAALINSLAEQNAKLVEAIHLLRIRTRLLLWAGAAQGAVLAGVLLYLVLR